MSRTFDRLSCRLCLAFTLVLALAAGPLTAQPPIQDFAGTISVLRYDTPTWGVDAYGAAQQAGVDWVRMSVFWNYLGTASDPYAYNSNGADIYYTSLYSWQHGIRVYAILNLPNNVASLGWIPPAVPANVYQTYLKVAEDQAYYYGYAIEGWEAGGELNGTDSFWNTVYYSGAQYAQLLRDLHAALLRGYQRRTDYARLVAARGGEGFRLYAAGTAGTDLVWIGEVAQGLEQLYAQYHDGPYMSGFSTHPYSAPAGPDATTIFNNPSPPGRQISHGTFLQNIDWAKSVLQAHPQVPQELYISEYGWSTLTGGGPQVVTQADQAVFIAQSLLEAHGSKKLARTLVGALADSPPFPTYPFWGYLGILNQDTTPKPSYRAVQAAVHQLTGLTLRRDLGWLLSNGHAYLYGGAGRQVLAFWNATQVPLNVKLSANAHARVLNHLEDVLQDHPVGTTSINPVALAAPKYLEVTGGTITEVAGVKLTASGALNLAGFSAVPTTWKRASSTLAGSSTDFAFDGNLNTLWNSGAVAPGWLEIKLYDTQRVRAVLLTPAQLPSGGMDHRIDLAVNYGAYQEVARVYGYVGDGMQLLVQLPQAYDNVSSVRVRTVAPPANPPVPSANSWVAWKEIQILQ